MDDWYKMNIKRLEQFKDNEEVEELLSNLKRLIIKNKISARWLVDINNIRSSVESIRRIENSINITTEFNELIKLIREKDSWIRRKRKDINFIKEEVKRCK